MVATSSVQQTKGFIQPQAPLENRLAGLTLTRLPQTTQSYAQDITTPADSDYLTKTTSAAQSLPRSDSMSTLELEGFKAQVHQDYALFTLLKVFLNEDQSLFEACLCQRISPRSKRGRCISREAINFSRPPLSTP